MVDEYEAEYTKFYRIFKNLSQRYPVSGDEPIWLISDSSIRFLISQTSHDWREWVLQSENPMNKEDKK